jgi:putative ABC transport system substrate-binding protein
VLLERYADGKYEQAVHVATELAGETPDVIVSTATVTHEALNKVTKTLPIVTTLAVDPVRSGYADSLGRPGRNYTGLTAALSDVFPKHVELLKASMPKLSRVAVLMTPLNNAHAGLLQSVEAVAKVNSLQVVPVRVSEAAELIPGFAAMRRERAEGLIILGDTFFVQNFARIAELAVSHRIATIYSTREFPELGGLMSYGPNFRDNYRRAAAFVVKILKGASPSDLPFEQPTKFELVVNRKTAAALALNIPADILIAAETVID